MSNHITDNSTLFSCRISVWQPKKVDKKASKKVVTEAKAKDGTAKVDKYLLPQDIWSPLVAYQQMIRRWVEARTLPWLDGGTRICPVAMSLEIADKFRTEFKPTFTRMVEETFTDALWPGYLARAQEALAELYNAADYPANAAAARAKYRLETLFSPIPSSADFRTKQPLDPSISAELEGRMNAVGNDIREGCYEKLQEPLLKLVESLKKLDLPQEDGKGSRRFHGSLVRTLTEVCKLLPSFNLTNDPQVEEIRREVMARITRFEVDTLKEDADVRREVVDDAQEILKKMGLA